MVFKYLLEEFIRKILLKSLLNRLLFFIFLYINMEYRLISISN